MAKCLHQLIGPTNVKKTKSKKEKVKKEVTTLETKPIFVWMSEYQMAFDVLKIALTRSPVLGYPNFNRGFFLETDASLKGLGATLSHQDNTSKVCVVAYAS